MKHIEYLKQDQHSSQNQDGEHKEKESSPMEENSLKTDFLVKVASLEIQIKEQQDLLVSKDSQINTLIETIFRQESKLQENQDVIQENQNEIIVLERKNKHLEGVLLRMETAVEKSKSLQAEYFNEMIKLREQTQEQAALLDEKEDQLNVQSLKMKYLSDLCCQAQEAMYEDKATIADLKYDIQDLQTTVDELKEDLEECKHSLFTANQMITLTGRRDSRLKSHVQRLASYYRNKESGSCFPFKMFGVKQQQSQATHIVSKLVQVLFSEEQN